MKSITVLIITLIIGFSCTNRNQDQFWFLEKDIDYNRVKNVFAKYVSFFPEKGNSKRLNCTWSLNPDVEYNLKVVFAYDDVSFEEEKKRLENLAIAKYLANNDSLLVLNRFSTIENYGYPDNSEIKIELIEQEHFDDFMPIPNFSNFSTHQTNNTVCKLPEDFTIYVLDSKSGIFLEEKQLTKGEYMPENWKHGYSKGAALSDKSNEMIYWVIIW